MPEESKITATQRKVIAIHSDSSKIRLDVAEGVLLPKHENQLAFWGIQLGSRSGCFEYVGSDALDVALKAIRYFEKCDLPYEVHGELRSRIERRAKAEGEIGTALVRGKQLKEAALPASEFVEFLLFLKNEIPRSLRQHQLKAAAHLLAVGNGANFSVPGSGKTTVVLVVYEYLRRKGQVDALFVVGPPSSFGPWRTEFREVLGLSPNEEIFAGGNASDRQARYKVRGSSEARLYLTSFQTLQRDHEHVRQLFENQGIRFFVVLDEAHYIKQVGGLWAGAALKVAEAATKRCVLTGTPFPRTYSDAFNLFDFLWPSSPPLEDREKHQIELASSRNQPEEAAAILDRAIAPLFYRVRKEDLGLAPQVFHEPLEVEMKPIEARIYDALLDRTRNASMQDYFRDVEISLRIRRGRMMRLRQCVSNAAMLRTAIADYSEDLFVDEDGLGSLLLRYPSLETPAKVDLVLKLISEMVGRGEKVVLWSNFIKTLSLLSESLDALGIGTRMIYGGTPIESESGDDEVTRERIVREFNDKASGIDVLVANPAACAESISLHKSCSNAIYYDLSYNCAQFLQSLDRIHRVGGSERKESHYYFLQYKNSIDFDILQNVRAKAERMSGIVDQEYPIYSLDMWADDEEIEAYERLFGKRD
ncbi:DEAD/DEAH box helicase [Haloferula sp. A504]|uniref:DEAD/DEAH box helicase n=1 Tax=Haloferula sp. A504 TaxID=3373601 RepID=UPI0031C4427D|nr:DEAD/DEAH box helicase [Verrucomicrobiaceae bacterium E54]